AMGIVSRPGQIVLDDSVWERRLRECKRRRLAGAEVCAGGSGDGLRALARRKIASAVSGHCCDEDEWTGWRHQELSRRRMIVASCCGERRGPAIKCPRPQTGQDRGWALVTTGIV